jgi:phage protein D
MSTAAIPLYQGQDFYVPAFEIRLDKKVQGQDVIHDVLSASYKDSLTDIDTFELTINNWDAETRKFKYSDSDLFDPGKKLELFMGYYPKDQLVKMISGEITSLKPTFPSGGQPTLAVSGLNLLHRLRTQQESHSYEKLTDSQIARQIAGRLNIDIETPDQATENKFDYLLQDNQYDIVFLMERARRIGYDLFVKEGEVNGKPQLFFGRSVKVRQPAYRLTYGKSLVEFQPELTTANQVSEVVVRGWDPVKKEKIEEKATRAELTTKGVGESGGQQAIEQSFNQRKEIIATRPIESKAEAKTLAKETLEKIAKDMVKGHGSTVGLPAIRTGVVLEVEGLGTRFSGRYFITSTTHAIGDSGYTVQFECRREEL